MPNVFCQFCCLFSMSFAILVAAAELSDAQMPPALPSVYQAQASVVGYRNRPDPILDLQAKVDSLQLQLNSLHPTEVNWNEHANRDFQRGGFYGGAGVLFAKPHLKEAFQHSQINIPTGTQSLLPFEYDYESSLRAWIGYTAETGFGLRASYWGFEADGRTSSNTADGMNVYGAHAITVIFPANIFAQIPGEQLVNMDSLKTQIMNYYGTYQARAGSFDITGGMGLRHASLVQSLNSVVTDTGGVPIRQLNWQREYEGLGPAVMFELKRQIGCTPFSVVGQGGGSLLFGTKTINRTVLGDQSPQPASPFLNLAEADEVVGIGEFGFGVEWSRSLYNGHNLNARATYEGQLWAEAGAPTLGFLGFEGFGVQVELTR